MSITPKDVKIRQDVAIEKQLDDQMRDLQKKGWHYNAQLGVWTK